MAISNINQRIPGIMIILCLTACAAYIEDYPPVEDTGQPSAFPSQPGGTSSGQTRQPFFNPQAFQEQNMQQRRAGVGGGMASTASAQVPGGVIGPRTAAQQQGDRQSFASEAAAAGPTANKEAFARGKQLYEQKNFTQAAQEFEAFLKDNDEADEIPEALYYLGNCYFELENWVKSASAYKKIDQLYHPYPLAPQASLRLAQCYEKMGQPKLAEAVRANMKYKYSPGSY